MTVPRSVSLEIKVGKEKDTELLDLLEIEAVSSENHFVYESLQRDIRELLADLTTRERQVIECFRSTLCSAVFSGFDCHHSCPCHQ